MSRAATRFSLPAALAIAIGGIWAGVAAGEVPLPEAPVMSAAGETLPGFLPHSRPAPAALGMGFTSEATPSQTAPELARIAFEVSRNVTFDTTGLPRCTLGELFEYEGEELPCPRSLVGEGTVISEITLPGKPTAKGVEGALFAFYGLVRGSPYLLARVTTGEPLPLTYVIPFAIRKGQGAFGTRLVANKMRRIHGKCARDHPDCFGQTYTFQGIYSHISYFRLFLHRRFTAAGRRRSFVNASCPPHGRSLEFPLENVSLRYVFGTDLNAVVSGRCKPPS